MNTKYMNHIERREAKRVMRSKLYKSLRVRAANTNSRYEMSQQDLHRAEAEIKRLRDKLGDEK